LFPLDAVLISQRLRLKLRGEALPFTAVPARWVADTGPCPTAMRMDANRPATARELRARARDLTIE
jgi:hypothetical protein